MGLHLRPYGLQFIVGPFCFLSAIQFVREQLSENSFLSLELIFNKYLQAPSVTHLD